MNKKILCIHPGIAYLPEIEAYKKYFLQYNINFIDSFKDLNNQYNENDFDILWYIMGTDFKNINKPKVHDYASLSTGKYIYIKDVIKKYFNKKPDLRLFLNKDIKNKYHFNDKVPFLIRDMGIDDMFFQKRNIEKKYDFVYLGAITYDRKINILFDKFKNDLKDNTLLVVGKSPADIYANYKDVSNIIFTGRISYFDVPKVVSQAEYGINMIPDIYPFNIQTSTKLIEYCALGLKIITTNYYWVEKLEDKYNANFFKIKEDLSDLEIEKIKDFNFKTPSLNNLSWNNIFNNINLIDNIRKII